MPNSNSQRLTTALELSADSASYLDRNSQLIQLNKGAGALHKGDPVAGAYIVTQGCLRVYCYTPQGQESTLYLINPGETCVFAINCLFQQLLYPAWVRADQDSQIVIIDGQAYRQLFTREPAIQNLTVSALSTAVFRLMQEVEQLKGWSLRQRLANFLLNRASSTHTVGITQQEIANHLGTGREVIARLLGEFRAQKLIATGRGNITLAEPQALALCLQGLE